MKVLISKTPPIKLTTWLRKHPLLEGFMDASPYLHDILGIAHLKRVLILDKK
jgi:hypothetical protein